MRQIFLTLAVALITALSASAYDFQVDGLCYNINDDNASVTVTRELPGNYSIAYSSATGPLNIPETVEYNGRSFTVTAIDHCAFFDCVGFTGPLTIPATVTEIGRYAFCNCSGLTGSIVIPEGVTSIPYACFSGCTALDGTLTLPTGLTSIDGFAFDRCSGLTGDLRIPNSVSKIGIAAFQSCSALDGTLALPEALSEIGHHAFYGCSGLHGSIVIPDAVKGIGSSAFANCRSLDGTLTLGNGITMIDSYAFSGCQNLNGTLTLPGSLTTIGQLAFFNCSSITGTLTIPKSVQDIGFQALSYCSGFDGFEVEAGNPYYDSRDNCRAIILTESNTLVRGCRRTVLPATVTTIGYDAFAGCAGMPRKIEVPATITCILSNAYRNCADIEEIVLPDDLLDIDSDAFDNTSWYDAQPNGLLYLGHVLCGYKGASDPETFRTIVPPNTAIAVKEGTKAIANAAFYSVSYGDYAVNFTSLTIPNSVVRIGDYAFCDCTGLSGELHLPDSVTYIGEMAFSGCSSLTGSLSLPASLTNIAGWAFGACWGMTGTLTIPEKVSSIDECAFLNCGFSSVVIPASVRKIDENAFAYCYRLTSIYNHIPAPRIVTLGSDVFKNVPTDACTLYVTRGASDAYRSADQWCDFTHIVETDWGVRGDVNGDGIVDVDDMNVVINIMLRKAAATDWPAADLDANGVVDVDDMNLVINVMLRKA